MYFDTKLASFYQVVPRVINGGSGGSTEVISLDNSVEITPTIDGFDLSIKQYVDPIKINVDTANATANAVSDVVNNPTTGLATKTDIAQVNSAIDTKQADYNI
jgi:hypothetical protein